MSGEATYAAFDRDVPEARREDVMTMLAEAAQGTEHECVTILDSDRLDAINVRVHGIIEIEGNEHSFQLEDGNWNGTVLLAWDEDKPFEHHKPIRWALQPRQDLIDDALQTGRGEFLVFKWDAILANRPKVAAIPAKYSYDRHFQPGGAVEKHWQEAAAKHQFVIVTEETATETRAMLQARKGETA